MTGRPPAAATFWRRRKESEELRDIRPDSPLLSLACGREEPREETVILLSKPRGVYLLFFFNFISRENVILQ